VKQRILYVVNNAAFFVSHRLPIALAARERGDEVALVTGQPASATLEAAAAQELIRHRLQHSALAFTSSGVNPAFELKGLWQLVRAMRRFRPTIVHCASPKGVLFGGIAARVARVPGVVLAVSGQGYLFTTPDAGGRWLLRSIYSMLVRLAYGHRNKRVIVQNRDDLSMTLAGRLARADEIQLISGSGVPLEPLVSLPIEAREPLVVLPARMLRDKGVVEFAAAASQLRRGGLGWTFALVGTADYQNPSSIAEAQLRDWERQGAIEWWGHHTDMVSVYRRASIVCLPSYREGMPRALLEAAAAGCAVITTDAVGCREAVDPGVTADLVPVGDAAALADALRRLINEPERIRRYAESGRKMATERFDLDHVVQRVLRIYDEIGTERIG